MGNTYMFIHNDMHEEEGVRLVHTINFGCFWTKGLEVKGRETVDFFSFIYLCVTS